MHKFILSNYLLNAIKWREEEYSKKSEHLTFFSILSKIVLLYKLGFLLTRILSLVESCRTFTEQ